MEVNDRGIGCGGPDGAKVATGNVGDGVSYMVQFEKDVVASKDEEVRVFGKNRGYNACTLEVGELSVGFIRCDDVLHAFCSKSLIDKYEYCN